jgi:hypothetical protein
MRTGVIAVTLVFLLSAMTLPALAHNKGCSPGFWKNHNEAWVGYSPGQTLGSVFAAPSPFDTETLDSALDGGGGPGLDGALEIMFRAAVAGLLNRDFPANGFINRVNAKIATGNRDTILKFAGKLDMQNNEGCVADTPA